MPAYYDQDKKSWYCKFYYTDYTGQKRQKMKRGFALQREAKEWERKFLEHLSRNPDISFQTLIDQYKEYIKLRVKPSTFKSKFTAIDGHILPYFKNRIVSEISPSDIVSWQNVLMQKELSGPYLRLINVQLNAVFNYAVEYYGLTASPCKAKLIGTDTKRKTITFWTYEEYKTFMAAVDDIIYQTSFELLYYTGMRVGELLALTPGDFDFEKKVVHITKTFSRIDGKDIIGTPKTPKSTRDIYMPDFLSKTVKNFISKNYGIHKTDRLFPFLKERLAHAMKRYCDKSGVKFIRIHDIRHSHASLLIEMGASPLLIAERLGHERVEITLNIYSHLYPNKQEEIVRQLENLRK